MTAAVAGEEAAGLAEPPARLRWWREVVYIVVVYAAYSVVRNRFGSGAGGTVDPGPAYDHAKAVIALQRDLGLYVEARLQDWYLDLPANGLIRFWNVFYGVAHFVVTAGALVWLYRRDPRRYPLWRNTLAATTLLALVGFATYSLMPPRLLDDPGEFGACQLYAPPTAELARNAGEPPCDRYGFVDTIDRYGGWASFGSDEMKAVSNQYAAMPSMHIGWSTWSALVLVPMLRRGGAKAIAGLYPVATLVCILVTANHYWIDGVAGLACLGVGYLVARSATRWFDERAATREMAQRTGAP